MLERFRAEYPGSAYSFGCPACPRLEDQTSSSPRSGPRTWG
jgi:5-methyltetrahydrofolate--homocysteine methyltransferase